MGRVSSTVPTYFFPCTIYSRGVVGAKVFSLSCAHCGSYVPCMHPHMCVHDITGVCCVHEQRSGKYLANIAVFMNGKAAVALTCTQSFEDALPRMSLNLLLSIERCKGLHRSANVLQCHTAACSVCIYICSPQRRQTKILTSCTCLVALIVKLVCHPSPCSCQY